MGVKYPALYRKYYLDKGDERLELFRVIRNRFRTVKGLYPGSFAHITPSLIFPQMVYVDLDKRCRQFFAGRATEAFINANKEYDEKPAYRFYALDFSQELPERVSSFDLLISLYAGFVSRYCRKYLKKGGILLANNSHGDAPLAYLDEGFAFIGVVKRRGSRFFYSDSSLDAYFVTKSGKDLDKEIIENTMRGPAYQKTAYAYLFEKG